MHTCDNLFPLSLVCWFASRSRVLISSENSYKILVYNLESNTFGNSETAKKHVVMLTLLKLQSLFFIWHFFKMLINYNLFY